MIKPINGILPSSRSINSNYSFYIENLGCAKNQVDAEIFAELLFRKGWRWSDDPQNADCILINSCAFIVSAKAETIAETLEYRNRYPQKKIVLTGCFAQRYADSIGRKFSDIDGIIGNQSPRRLVELLDAIMDGRRIVEIPEQDTVYPRRNMFFSYPGSIYVKISEGCNNRCTYCAIPIIRGPLRSRSAAEIQDEISVHIENGMKEIVLLSQDSASFAADMKTGENLLSLLNEIMKLPGDFWLRLLYLHPDHFPEALIPFIRDNPRVLPYFDIPFQHASAKVLQKMGRSGNAEKYMDLITKIRTGLPGAVVRSTFLVGFPGETDEDFSALLRFQEQAQLDWMGVFTYSREKDTKAYGMQRSLGYLLSKRKGEKRKAVLEEIQQNITTTRLKRFIGSVQRLLIEEPVRGETLHIARTYFQAPEVDGLTVVSGEGVIPGTFTEGRITNITTVDLEAVLVGGTGT